MKTIKIPLELAEELLTDTKCNAKIMYDEFNSGKGSHEEYLPESYHKLKKLVEEQTTGATETMENAETYKVWRLPFNSLEEQEEYDRIKEEYLRVRMPRFPDELLPD